MEDDDRLALLVMGGFAIVLLLLVLGLPVKGNIAGNEVELPLIGWASIGVFAIFGFFVYFKHRA